MFNYGLFTITKSRLLLMDVLRSTTPTSGFHSPLMALTCMQQTWHASHWDILMPQDMAELDFSGKNKQLVYASFVFMFHLKISIQ